MKLTLVLLFLGLSFVSGEYKFPDLNENEINEGKKSIFNKFDDFKNKAHDMHLLNPFFVDLLNTFNTIQEKNDAFNNKMHGFISSVKDSFYLESVEKAQKELHRLASVQYLSFEVVAVWADQRVKTIDANNDKTDGNIRSRLYRVKDSCKDAAIILQEIAEQTFNDFEDMKKSLQAVRLVNLITSLGKMENTYEIKWTIFDKHMRDAVNEIKQIIHNKQIIFGLY